MTGSGLTGRPPLAPPDFGRRYWCRSLPHMPEAFISTTTSPSPGVGSGKSKRAISRSPGKTTPRIVSSILGFAGGEPTPIRGASIPSLGLGRRPRRAGSARVLSLARGGAKRRLDRRRVRAQQRPGRVHRDPRHHREMEARLTGKDQRNDGREQDQRITGRELGRKVLPIAGPQPDRNQKQHKEARIIGLVEDP